MKSKLVIIVGVGNSFGLSIAGIFGKQGYDIVLTGRNMEKLNKDVELLKANHITAYPIKMDVSDNNSIKNAFQDIKSLQQPIELLIYNAVARRQKTVSKLDADEVMEDFKINVGGAITCTSELLPVFHAQNHGAIIYTGGGVAITPSLQAASLSISKAGLRNYAINLSNELKNSPIFIGTLTITQPVAENTNYSPDFIGGQFFKMFTEKTESEIII